MFAQSNIVWGVPYSERTQNGEMNNMKNRLSEFRLPFAAIVAAAVYLASPRSSARAQNTFSTNASAAATSSVSLVTTRPTSTTQAPPMPYGAREVLKMYQGGVPEDVIISYINSTSLSYHLSSDGILYLQSLGIPQKITKAMTLRDDELQQQQAMQKASGQPLPAPTVPPNVAAADEPPVQVVTPTTPAPDVSEIVPDYGNDYPYYDYGYDEPYYFGAPLIVGGWGWGHGGHRRGYGGLRGGHGGLHGGGGFHGGFGGGGAFHGGFGGGHGGGGGHR